MGASQNPTGPIDPNPYAPPGIEVSCELPVLPAERWDEVQLQVVGVVRRWYTRIVRITGTMDAEIRYECAGNGERIYINDRLAARSTMWKHELVTPRIDFYLVGQAYRIPATVEAAVSLWMLMRISEFRVRVAGKLIYDEAGGAAGPALPRS